MKKTHFLTMAAALLISSTAWAGALTIPNTFTAGTKAVAAQVNANFTAAKTAVDDNDARITTNAAAAATNATNITANTTAITALQNAAPVRTINVSPVIGGGGVIDAVASGNALIAAVAAITGSSPTNQYTVKLEPGTYDLVAQILTLPDGVNLEGSGQEVTMITGATANSKLNPLPSLIEVLGSASIRHITILNSTVPVEVPFTPISFSCAMRVNTGTVLIENATLKAGQTITTTVSGATTVIMNSRLLVYTTNTGLFSYVGLSVNSIFKAVSSELGTLGTNAHPNDQCFSSYKSNFTATTATCQ